MKRFVMVLAVFAALALALPAMAADVKIKGDFNNRFMYTNHMDWLTDEETGKLDDGNVTDFFGEGKYRMWVNASSNDGKVVGVYAIELGALEYGKTSSVGKSVGGAYSGDGVNIETRWAYTDFQLPWACNKARVRMGLQPFKVSTYLWSETVMGVTADIDAGPAEVILGWLRPERSQRTTESVDNEDLDFLYGRVNFKPADATVFGVYALYGWGDDDNAAVGGAIADNYFKKLGNKYDTSVAFLGLNGKTQMGDFFANWDLIYETGSVDEVNVGGVITDYDVNSYFIQLTAGYKIDNWKFTGKFWYASGDDDPSDDDLDAYMAIDVDVSDNICLFEGTFTDDDVFTPRPYLEDKGFIMWKGSADYKASKKLTLGASLMYMMTAEDIEYVDNNSNLQKEDEVGVECDAYLKYKLYDNLEFAINMGYLFAGDALDYYEVDKDGSSDEDIFISSARVRYKF